MWQPAGRYFLNRSRAFYCKVKSIKETLGVGTRMRIHRFREAQATSPNAFAAPVDVGIIAMAAARARRKSL